MHQRSSVTHTQELWSLESTHTERFPVHTPALTWINAARTIQSVFLGARPANFDSLKVMLDLLSQVATMTTCAAIQTKRNGHGPSSNRVPRRGRQWEQCTQCKQLTWGTPHTRGTPSDTHTSPTRVRESGPTLASASAKSSPRFRLGARRKSRPTCSASYMRTRGGG